MRPGLCIGMKSESLISSTCAACAALLASSGKTQDAEYSSPEHLWYYWYRSFLDAVTVPMNWTHHENVQYQHSQALADSWRRGSDYQEVGTSATRTDWSRTWRPVEYHQPSSTAPRLPLAAMTPLTTSRPHVLAPSRRSDMFVRQLPSGALDSGHVIIAIVSATPGSSQGGPEKTGPQTHDNNSVILNRFKKFFHWNPPHNAYVATLPCETVMSAKQAINECSYIFKVW